VSSKEVPVEVADVIDITTGDEAKVVQNDPKQHISVVVLLQDLVLQMKKMNKHLQSITGERFLDEELED
jgi:hypothetical protein